MRPILCDLYRVVSVGCVTAMPVLASWVGFVVLMLRGGVGEGGQRGGEQVVGRVCGCGR